MAQYEQDIARVATAIDGADAVLIGAGAGLSTAAGFTYSGARFDEHFSDFAQKYGFRDMYTGGFYLYETLEEMWAYWSRNIMVNRYAAPPNPVYENLRTLVVGHDYFVLTTNVDHCFQKAGFDKARLFYTQGDYGLFQCSKPCYQKTYDNEETVRKMFAEQRDMRIPSELIPHCPICGAPMSMNLRTDGTFVEDDGWHAAAARYEAFVNAHQTGKVVLLELGVGYNTPGIIKYPFWGITARNPQALFVTVNKGEAYVPADAGITPRAVALDADIATVLTDILRQHATGC